MTGPNYWSIDLAVSRLVALGGTQRVELRLEAFNLTNQFNWGNPSTGAPGQAVQNNFNAGNFGRITTQAGDPRIIQFGIKYDF